MIDQEEGMRKLAKATEEYLNGLYGEKMGFFICVSPYTYDSGVADYVSNTDRRDAIEWLRETADRLEQNQDIPATQGQKQ